MKKTLNEVLNSEEGEKIIKDVIKRVRERQKKRQTPLCKLIKIMDKEVSK